jgi:hypothetical protein
MRFLQKEQKSLCFVFYKVFYSAFCQHPNDDVHVHAGFHDDAEVRQTLYALGQNGTKNHHNLVHHPQKAF